MPKKSRADRHFACHRRWSRRTGVGQVAVGLGRQCVQLHQDAEEAARKRREEMGT